MQSKRTDNIVAATLSHLSSTQPFSQHTHQHHIITPQNSLLTQDCDSCTAVNYSDTRCRDSRAHRQTQRPVLVHQLETDRQRQRETDRQTDRQTDRHRQKDSRAHQQTLRPVLVHQLETDSHRQRETERQRQTQRQSSSPANSAFSSHS